MAARGNYAPEVLALLRTVATAEPVDISALEVVHGPETLDLVGGCEYDDLLRHLPRLGWVLTHQGWEELQAAGLWP